MQEDNGNQNPEEPYVVACSYGCKLVCVDPKFSKSFNSYLGEDSVYDFINSMIKESKYGTHIMKKNYNKELVMTKKDQKILKTLLNVEFFIIFMLKAIFK